MPRHGLSRRTRPPGGAPAERRAPVIHLVTPMRQLRGSEMHVMALHDLLAPVADVRIWSASRTVDPQLHERAHIRRILGRLAPFPTGGTLVIVGSFFWLGPWIRLARPERTVLIQTTDEPDALEARLRQLSHVAGPVELVFPSETLRARSRYDGVVELSPIRLDDFAASRERRDEAHPFTVGRISPDLPSKHYESDPSLYHRLTEAGVRVRLVGATCLSEALAGLGAVEVLPEILQADVPGFLRSLDCFVYRTSIPESYGRVVAEAMACGVPVVVQRAAGIAEHLEHGTTGFVADTDDEVVAVIDRLRVDRALARRVGQAGGEMIRRLQAVHSEAIREFYVSPPAQRPKVREDRRQTWA